MIGGLLKISDTFHIFKNVRFEENLGRSLTEMDNLRFNARPLNFFGDFPQI